MTRTKARRGTTLVEVMAAMMILALTVSAAGAMFPLGAFLRNRSGGYSRAAAIVQRKLEQVRKFPARSLTYPALEAAGIIDSSATSPASFNTCDSLTNELPNANGSLELTNAGTDVVRIDVTLTWRNVRGGVQRVSAMSQVIHKGIWVRP
jgi:prepilin-type N-terminal cleavage/methylation domain-containing protein